MSDDRRTNTASVLLYGEEIREMRGKDLERWKRRLARKIEAQKFKELSATTEERRYQEGSNDAYDAVLSIIKAKWKNI